MAESPLFKRAFVRGLNTELIRQGVVVYPSKEAADFSSDYVAENSNMPDPYLRAERVNVKVAAALCENLVKAADYICQEAGSQYSPDLTKTARDSSPVAAATDDAWAIMEKCAAETGGLMEGGDAENDMPAAAAMNAEAAQETNRRPENYANLGEDGVGNYEGGDGQGEVGTLEEHPEAPAATGSGSNSLTEGSKSASLASIVRRISKRAADEGSLMQPGKEKNDMPAAAQYNTEAAQEMNRRGENYANNGGRMGGPSPMDPPAKAEIGAEMKHPEAPAATDSGSNTITALTTGKSAAFNALFQSTAQEIVPFLPQSLPDDVKVAQVRYLMGLDSSERAQHLQSMYLELGVQKTAAYNVASAYLKQAMMPPGLAEFVAKKEDKGEDDEEEESEEEESEEEESEEEEKKEASMRSLTNLQAALARLNA